MKVYPHPEGQPRLLFADPEGRLYDHPGLWTLGLSGYELFLPDREDFISLPEGSALYVLPDRHPVGLDPQTRTPVVLYENPFRPGEPAFAVAAFLAPAHTQLYLAPYEPAREDLPPLPLYSYACVGWWRGRFWATAFRSDWDTRQEARLFSPERIDRAAVEILRRYPHNRLVRHLVENCVRRYRCPAARNFVLGRFEAPVPVSPGCNARCLGCLSEQPEDGPHVAQERITFVPTPREIAEAMVPHLKRPGPVMVSFGQGCEGEPLLQARIVEEALILIRGSTPRGTVNLNTNGSRPEDLERLARAGLDSVRISLASAREHYHRAYFRPAGWGLEEVRESIRIMKRYRRFVSLNYFIFPGFTDEEEELEALSDLLALGVDFIQLRNFAIDPLWFLTEINYSPGRSLGLKEFLRLLKKRFPGLRFGYFNPYLR
ncbi:radical SAM protein [Thermosulfurimonas sp. F29]|uniref:radical SAM protein n=1 Tax=Thermosulfurimonas sp. F29 TaxID=2867247 RepID=UPI001C835A83|nr:radical SAM protein [Thermosulfurimonas sp. F29]MBX6422346.1 radical SAM protein [Thermosulfurimonas sp. F29]